MFTRAALALQQNDVKLATAKYREIAGDSSLPQPYRDAALIAADGAGVRFASAAGGHLAASAAGETRHALVRHRGRNDRTRASQAGPDRRRPRSCSPRSPKTRPFPTPSAPAHVQVASSLGVDASAGSPSGPVGPTMIKHKSIRIAVMIAAALAASGCGVFKKKGPSTPVLGERIAVLTGESDVEVDPATTALPMSLPQPVVNTDMDPVGRQSLEVRWASWRWRGAGARLLRQRRPGQQPDRAARVGSGRRQRPRVHDGHARDCSRVRRAHRRAGLGDPTPTDRGDQAALYGGGIAYDNGRIYATNGLGYVAALDERNGGIVWQVRPGGPLRGAPSVAQWRGLRDQPGQPDLFAQAKPTARPTGRRPPRWKSPACSARPRRPLARARSLPASRRASSTPIATRTGVRCGRHAAAYEHPNQRLVALRRRCRSGDRQRAGVRGRPGRAHGRARPHHRPAAVGAEHRRYRYAVGRWRLGLRHHRRGEAALHLPAERPHPLDQPAAAVPEGQVEEGRDRIFRPGACGRTA